MRWRGLLKRILTYVRRESDLLPEQVKKEYSKKLSLLELEQERINKEKMAIMAGITRVDMRGGKGGKSGKSEKSGRQ